MADYIFLSGGMSERTLDVEKDQDRKALFAKVRRVVVKLGTRVLTASGNALNIGIIEQLAADVADLRARGVQVAIVSSGL